MKVRKPNRKFKDRKAKIKQYRTDMGMAIKEFVYETLFDAGVPEKQAKKISFQAMKEESKQIAEAAGMYLELWASYEAEKKANDPVMALKE